MNFIAVTASGYEFVPKDLDLATDLRFCPMKGDRLIEKSLRAELFTRKTELVTTNILGSAILGRRKNRFN